MVENRVYNETLSSAKTYALFVTLTVVFTLLSIWRWLVAGTNTWMIVLIFFAVFFLFCSINYRTLKTRITPGTVRLTFGIFTWEDRYHQHRNLSSR